MRDVFDAANEFPYIAPDFNEDRLQMYRFLQSPPHPIINSVKYDTKINTWNADIHLLSTYCFLSKEETQKFASEDQIYLIKDVYEHKYENITGSKRVRVE